MGRKQRKFVPDAVNHCYQRTTDGSVIFYNVSDYLVCFTQICVAAIKHKVKVLAITLMPDHLHQSVIAHDKEQLSAYVQAYAGPFAAAHNRICKREKPLFQRPFGSVPKVGDKNVRSNLVYVGNNGPERKLSAKAEEYPWSFLAYYRNPHPYSEPLKLREASRPMRRAVSVVNDRRSRMRPLKYQTLQWMFKPLSRKEKLQLVDFVVTQYNVIDYDAAAAFFGGFPQMIEAMHITKGSEYEIQEEFEGWSDTVYSSMCRLVLSCYPDVDIHQVLSLPEEKRHALSNLIQQRVKASRRQVEKFLRIM